MTSPTNIIEVRRILGMCGFCRKHVPQFILVAPITYLTHSKVEFKWTDSCQQMFEGLKAKFIEAHILMTADVSKPFVVTTDASDTPVGRVLSQTQGDGSDKAVGYFSKNARKQGIQ